MKAKETFAEFISGIDKKSLARTRVRMEIAIAIDEELRAQGISQKQLAERLGKSESEISAILSGGRNFTIDSLTDICEELHMHLLDVEPGHSYFAKEISLNYSVSKGKAVRVFYMQDDYEVYPLGMLSCPDSKNNRAIAS
ncbi:MAG: helix-turn-helix transcriptional regulator [Bacteroidales bacterium]|nr:helix-turn-helix transcriptional regulator [Bacteroidales bacterium]